MNQVTAFGVRRVRRSGRVTYAETRRMYSFPAQCSPLLRANSEAGCVTARSSATEGVGERTDTRPRLLLVHREVLEDRVAIRPRGGRVEHRGHELVLAQTELRRHPRQRVAGEARVGL